MYFFFEVNSDFSYFCGVKIEMLPLFISILFNKNDYEEKTTTFACPDDIWRV